ncbi:hypothetical protein Leryth_014611 [Lithospermum erythrorhizon]|nr:hypothetical protein Leryth_014611 [Lithospermum erythrorhizon]
MSGGYTINQTLSSEAASLVKQALTLARRRGHAQVTPLHVAFSMLSSSTSLFRRGPSTFTTSLPHQHLVPSKRAGP